MTNIIGVVSGKGGVGTTTVTVNVGCALTGFGRDCLVVDGDLNKSNIGLQLGSPVVERTLHDVLSGKHRIHDSAYMHSSGLKMILGNANNDDFELKIKSDNMKETIFSLVGACEIVLIDCGNGLNEHNKNAIISCDKLLLVVEADIVSVLDTLKVIRFAKAKGIEIIGAIVNRHFDDGVNLDIENVNQMLEVPIIGVVPFDHDVRKSLHVKHPVCYSHPQAESTAAFKKIAASIIGERYEDQLIKEERSNLFTYALRQLGFPRENKDNERKKEESRSAEKQNGKTKVK
jgi:septum site-determining protein MinD